MARFFSISKNYLGLRDLQHAQIKFQTLDNYCKNNITRYDRNILVQICTCLKCDITDIIEFISDNQDD